MVCNKIKRELGISVMIVDSNDFGREILGKSDDICLDDEKLKKIIRDNPTRARKRAYTTYSYTKNNIIIQLRYIFDV